MSTAIAILENPAQSTPSDAEQLGAELTELKIRKIYRVVETRGTVCPRPGPEDGPASEEGSCSTQIGRIADLDARTVSPDKLSLARIIRINYSAAGLDSHRSTGH